MWHFLSSVNHIMLSFIQGIYFSNSFDKSRHYCDRYENQTSNLMLLSEVGVDVEDRDRTVTYHL